MNISFISNIAQKVKYHRPSNNFRNSTKLSILFNISILIIESLFEKVAGFQQCLNANYFLVFLLFKESNMTKQTVSNISNFINDNRRCYDYYLYYTQ